MLMRMADANEESGAGALEISKSKSVRAPQLQQLRDLGTTRRASSTAAPVYLFRASRCFSSAVAVRCHGTHVEKQCCQGEELLLSCTMAQHQAIQLADRLAHNN